MTDKADPPRPAITFRDIVTRLGLGALLGGFSTPFLFGDFGAAPRDLLALTAAGSAAGVAIAVLSIFLGRRHGYREEGERGLLAIIGLLTLAGAVGGGVWGWVMESSLGVLRCAGFGALLLNAYVLLSDPAEAWRVARRSKDGQERAN